MRLKRLLEVCELVSDPVPEKVDLLDTPITDITLDSRTVTPGCLFIAVQGYAQDGHAYIGQALEKGAAAVVAQHIPDTLSDDQKNKILRIKESRKAVSAIAAAFYGHPSKDMTLVGVTGTNGKTTITWILEQIFTTCGYHTGVIGTVNIRYAGQTHDTPVTTPDAVSLQKTLARMRDAGVTHVVMEVSSHSLDQYRVEDCHFDVGVFTNLTQDHLDYHQDLEDYFNCKKRLFTELLGKGEGKSRALAVVNRDDPFGKRLAIETPEISCPIIGVSHTPEAPGAQVRALGVKDEITGLDFTLETHTEKGYIRSALTGLFNLENILCAAGAALGLGIELPRIIQGIECLKRVPGRLEKLSTPLNRHIFVDYAHTPDALASILKTLANRAPARLITVFGCGGDRDTTKRAPMGRIACTYSDLAIVTSDNPRTENPGAIVADIVQGIAQDKVRKLNPDTLGPNDKGYLVEVDRAAALKLAVKLSRPNDIIVAAGKGHETYQITNAGTIHFDDAEVLTEACAQLVTPQPWSVQDIEKALGVSSIIPAMDAQVLFSRIGTDSRKIQSDMVFLALEGEKFDGHTFVPDLAGKGVKAFVVKQGFFNTLPKDIQAGFKASGLLIFEVSDTLEGLGKLAHFHCRRCQAKIVAITGSNGKTSSRKMIHEIFAAGFDTLATQGNFNNEVGMPLTLLDLAPVHQWAVIEMGMNHPGEISRLSAIARPDIALVTNTSGAHLEGLKTADNVARAKAEIFESVKEGGTAVIFADDPRRKILEDLARSHGQIKKFLFFGTQDTADFRLDPDQVAFKKNKIHFTLSHQGEELDLRINTPARFMVNNALGAIAVARAAGIDTQTIQAGLARFAPVKGRMDITTLSNGMGLIDDTYNANPASMTQALETLARLSKTGLGFAALGDMLELGPDSDQLHRQIGHLAARLNPARLYLFGSQTAHIKAGAIEQGLAPDKIFLGTKEEIAQALADDINRLDRQKVSNSWLLLKGSRGMAMETLIPGIESRLTPTLKDEK